MRTREIILQDLITLNGNIDSLEVQLSQLPWDSTVELVRLNKKNIINAITKCISKDITTDELVKWANLIECRDDIGFDYESTKEIIFEIANPEINDLKLKRLTDMIQELTNS